MGDLCQRYQVLVIPVFIHVDVQQQQHWWLKCVSRYGKILFTAFVTSVVIDFWKNILLLLSRYSDEAIG
jgi:hypothetical protein